MGTTARVGLGDTTLRELSTPQACRLLSRESWGTRGGGG